MYTFNSSGAGYEPVSAKDGVYYEQANSIY